MSYLKIDIYHTLKVVSKLILCNIGLNKGGTITTK